MGPSAFLLDMNSSRPEEALEGRPEPTPLGSCPYPLRRAGGNTAGPDSSTWLPAREVLECRRPGRSLGGQAGLLWPRGPSQPLPLGEKEGFSTGGGREGAPKSSFTSRLEQSWSSKSFLHNSFQSLNVFGREYFRH